MEIRAYGAAQLDFGYSHLGCEKLLAQLGFEYRKTEALPRVADAAKQGEFIAMYENILNSLADDEAVYFAGAVHPEYQSKPASGWVNKGTNPMLKTTSGSARVNIQYALNHEIFDTPLGAQITVDSVSVVQLLAKIEACNHDKRIIWDNDAYHKGSDVGGFLARKNCRTHLIQLPSYCPQLNLIERLWAVIHQHVTYNRAYLSRSNLLESC